MASAGVPVLGGCVVARDADGRGDGECDAAGDGECVGRGDEVGGGGDATVIEPFACAGPDVAVTACAPLAVPT